MQRSTSCRVYYRVQPTCNYICQSMRKHSSVLRSNNSIDLKVGLSPGANEAIQGLGSICSHWTRSSWNLQRSRLLMSAAKIIPLKLNLGVRLEHLNWCSRASRSSPMHLHSVKACRDDFQRDMHIDDIEDLGPTPFNPVALCYLIQALCGQEQQRCMRMHVRTWVHMRIHMSDCA